MAGLGWEDSRKAANRLIKIATCASKHGVEADNDTSDQTSSSRSALSIYQNDPDLYFSETFCNNPFRNCGLRKSLTGSFKK